ncbi:2-oxoglutarate dehydrogenase, E1 subunit [Deinococcus proteolyticus MRP]|uniref:oxoglutarate dehydrogenase (succinyl-transferring) n=1 Tax=Deinococcus proteolyticus (strain ATCC 35074 / DSM 20540 / JCM 6276 / NBRC 101906 / NCIMB 13154 / VKM Ac-1939 / CCM 2703 / MRP) TaxID=693977 RepID=F0RL96_DEIPM|nr:2-oxoglutarate dehydrogenase E1 component [Deinococcus proteolyticus]ADY26888.1 2-oxoglutarate dehydrogenase, E1 subunit [Deinococcus proteolyticus MRP]
MTRPETIMSGGNAAFLDGLYEDYLADPQSVDPEWRAFFDAERGGVQERRHSAVQQAFYDLGRQNRRTVQATVPAGEASGAQQAISALITAHRVYGHLQAEFDPLGLHDKTLAPELNPEYYGLSAAQMNEQVKDGHFSGTVSQVLEQLRSIYCGPIGYEYNYLPSEEREWFQDQIERGGKRDGFTKEDKLRLLDRLNAAEGLEKYLHIKYVGQKRFSLEGSESFIPLVDRIITQAGKVPAIKEIVLGMAHRGRLNTLVNIFGKRPKDLFDEFEGKKVLSENPDISGDVKYHLGFSSDVKTQNGPLHLALAFNPSHLELVAPVVHGSTRARQDRRDETPEKMREVRRDNVLAITVHGDAAVIGQGVVMETLNMSRLRGFTTGGAIRIVINNQVGFTISDPRDSRSSRYCTDVAKIANAPVMHVNGDDLEAVAFAADLALAYRQQFGKDVFIDLVSFRRHGHNEADDPTMTQPIMYQKVKAHPGTLAVYAQKLIGEGVIDEAGVKALADTYRDRLDRGESVVDELTEDTVSDLGKRWAEYKQAAKESNWQSVAETAVSAEKLAELTDKMTTFPEGFELHRGVKRVMEARRAMGRGEQPLDWGMGEMLAYASLLDEGYNVRLSGEDSGRGTFVHRHAVVHDQRGLDPLKGDYLSLEFIRPGQGRAEVIDSTLSEEGVMAFEYGYSGSAPNTLVLWEAQFGDFANGAQAVIDQFIAAGETKWLGLSGLTLLLPHGYEGAGPEHSSARLERYLQLCAQNNMQVVVPSSASQIFHLLRRQMLRGYRKPLIVMTPKSLLRNKRAMSPLSELTEGRFRNVIGDQEVEKARRVVISSGKLHWEMFDAREEDREGYHGTALVRLEQLYPFPTEELAEELRRHPGAQVVWAQEEPENQGAWLLIREDLERTLAEVNLGHTLSHVSRKRAASTATGYSHVHVKEQAAVIAGALGEKISREDYEAQVKLTQEAGAQG